MSDVAAAVELRARYIFPIAGPPIADAAVTIAGGKIISLERQGARTTAHAGRSVDLGNAAILPGLINAHTHLEFSDLAAPLGRPGMPFADWIRAVVGHRRSRTDAERRAAVGRGLEESARCGTTLIGEIATPGWPADLYFDAASEADRPAAKVRPATANRPAATVFLELLGLSAERTTANAAAATEHARFPASVGLSPHAPYTVRPDLVRHAATLSRSHRIPLAMHLAESPDEIELLQSGRGPLYKLLSDFGAWDPAAIPRGIRPMDYLRLLSEADRALVIHGNYLNREEIAFLAAHADRMTVVYCPRTHAYFAHPPYPLAALLAAGVSVALGTDSRASNPDLNLLEELRFAAAHNPIAPAELLKLATLGGAKALGREHDLGAIAPGKSADLTIVSLPNIEAEPHELLFDPRAQIIGTIRAGIPIGVQTPPAALSNRLGSG